MSRYGRNSVLFLISTFILRGAQRNQALLKRSLAFAFGCCLAAAVSAHLAVPAKSADAAYIIHPGDQLGITVFGEQNLTQTVTVLPDGSATFPLIGRIVLGGSTVQQAERNLTSALSRYIRQPSVAVGIVSEGSYQVLVLGNVKTPGKYALQPGSHLTDAIAAAGGLGSTNGDLPPARVSTGEGVPVSVPLQRLLRDGDVSLNSPIVGNTVVYVPGPTTIRIEVVGAVDHPGEVEISEGDRLSMAIAKAGNSSNAHADLSNIRVTRALPDGNSQVMKVDLYRQLQAGDFSADVPLKKGDIVFVPEARQNNRLNGPMQVLFGILGRFVGL